MEGRLWGFVVAAEMVAEFPQASEIMSALQVMPKADRGLL
jgi:hypothetical protein